MPKKSVLPVFHCTLKSTVVNQAVGGFVAWRVAVSSCVATRKNKHG